MESFSKQVKVFDAFPKVTPEHQVRSLRGGLSTALTIFCMLLIAWVQIGGYLDGHVEQAFSVDKEIRLDLKINLDLVVAMPCKHLTTNAMDITSDTYMAAETLNFQGVDFQIPSWFTLNTENNHHETPEIAEILQENLLAEYGVSGTKLNEDAPACHIFGSIPVNHVKGEFFVIASGALYREARPLSPQEYNFSHVIYEYSYGEFFPLIDSTLDHTAKTTEKNLQQFKYFTKVVPTEFGMLGVNVDTYQYSVTELHHEIRRSDFQPPGIYFVYSFEPIKLIIKEKRLSFTSFVAKLATILLGLLISGGYLFRLYEKLVVILFGKKYAERDTEKKEGGLLDKSAADSLNY